MVSMTNRYESVTNIFWFSHCSVLKPDLDPFLSQNMCSLSKNDKNGYKRCQTMYQQIQRNEYNKFLLFHDNLFIELVRGGRGGGGGGL